MSRINGDKARSAVERRRRTAQRMKDRVKRAELALNPPAAKPPKVSKPKPAAAPAPAAKPAVKEAKPAEAPAAKRAAKPRKTAPAAE